MTDFGKQKPNIFVIKWQMPTEKRKQYDPARPNIGCWSIIGNSLENDSTGNMSALFLVNCHYSNTHSNDLGASIMWWSKPDGMKRMVK